MSNTNDRCLGITAKGERCKLPTKQGSDFCHHHHEERRQILEFFAEHREALIAFFAGAISDPVMSDIYDFLKDTLGYRHLVPPVPERAKGASLDIPYCGFPNILEYMRKRLGIELSPAHIRWLGSSEFKYFPFDSRDSSQGFIELVFPAAGRGRTGNGPIYVFHYKEGKCTEVAEMTGAWVEPDFTISPTALNVCFDAGSRYGEYRHEFRDGRYILVRHRENLPHKGGADDWCAS